MIEVNTRVEVSVLVCSVQSVTSCTRFHEIGYYLYLDISRQTAIVI